MRVSPAGARFDPLISTQVFGAISGVSPKALATRVTAGPLPLAVCEIVNVCPAIVIVAVRCAPGFASARYCTKPLPTPEVPEVIVNHGTLLDASQGHPTLAERLIVPTDVPEPRLNAAGVTPKLQFESADSPK